MRIGYSHWGFLGPGVLDTPDGGRSHRRTLVDGLTGRGHELVFLQANRDLDEAGLDFRHRYQWHASLPPLDVLFCEWRWPIPERNTTPCGAPGHTCDLHRQQELVSRYTDAGVPTILWDKDRRLPSGHPLTRRPNVTLCEPALFPSPGARRLLFPVADDVLHRADPGALAASPRPLPLVYIGNQYDRDDAFDRFFAPAAARLPHRVAGKWPRRTRWPGLTFTGRCAFPDVEPLYRTPLATVVLLPTRYARAGQITQRLFEAVLAGCLPITPQGIAGSDAVIPAELHARDGTEVHRLIQRLQQIANTPAHADLLDACLQGLDEFRLSRQLAALDAALEDLTHATAHNTRARTSGAVA